MNNQLRNIKLIKDSGQFRKSYVLGTAVAVIVLGNLFNLHTAVAEDATEPLDFNHRLYLGLSGGVSNLDPVSKTPALDVGDQRDTGASLFVGYDASPRFSIEGYYAELGESGIDFLGDDVGSVEYQVYGISVLGYVFNGQKGGLNRRQGFSGYLRAGVGGMANESNLDYERDHDVHFAVGTGIEYGFSNGIGVRAELNSFDSDAQYLNIGLLKRFGSAGVSKRVTTAALTPVVDEQPAEEQPAEEQPRAITPSEVAIDLPVAYFAFDKFDITDAARSRLDALAIHLANNESVAVLIQGNADAVGTPAYNNALSLRRASAARDYLASKGINQQRLSIEGNGETRPVATNNTAQGRALNRRVDFTLQ